MTHSLCTAEFIRHKAAKTVYLAQAAIRIGGSDWARERLAELRGQPMSTGMRIRRKVLFLLSFVPNGLLAVVDRILRAVRAGV